jgi:ComF family protein
MFNVRNTIRIFAGSLLDFVYPPLCLCCDNLLVDGNSHICASCWDSPQRVVDTLPLFVETRDRLQAGGVIDELVSLYVFEKERAIQKILHALKYGGGQDLGVELGRRLGLTMNQSRMKADVVIPIPLHKRKVRERGYNQSELIARGLTEITGISTDPRCVRRARFTETQTKLSKEERMLNMAGAFILSTTSASVKGSTIVLLDDVITTGSTIRSCAEVLKDAGACKIIAASVAIAE